YFQQDINPDYSVPGSSAGEDEEFPPLGQSPEDIRAVLEKAAGLAGSLGHKFNAPNDKNVFEKLVHRQSNFAQDRREVASENGERIYAEEYGNSGHADASLRGRRGQQEAFTDFERYQRTRRQAPDNAQEFDADYELLAEAEFGEETLDSNQFSGTGKLLVFGLGLVLLVVIIVLSVSFLGGPYFISLD
ncbi:MAG TPA: hypothetical protein PLP17_05535, partial [Oligoflexia bacterium]|nr:hypothetical protein [Oligoflexia bacterium]